jgi:rubrerythrin
VTRLTRRTALGLAAAAALSRPASALALTDEIDAVYTLMHREDAAAEAYRIAAVRFPDERLFSRIAEQDAAHALALRSELEALTVTATPPPPDAALTDDWAAPVAAAMTRRAALHAALGLENRLGRGYSQAARVVRDPRLLRPLATIAGNHAAQLATLRAAAGRTPFP